MANAHRIITLSNILTLVRLILAPVVAAALFYNYLSVAFGLFVIAALTDLVDGYLARLFNEQTHLGVLLDPIADKFFIMGSLSVLVFSHNQLLHLPVWFFCLLVVRESMVVVGSGVLYAQGIQRTIEPSLIGKLSAALQMLFIGWLFIQHFLQLDYTWVNDYAVIILVAASFISLAQYCYRFWCECVRL